MVFAKLWVARHWVVGREGAARLLRCRLAPLADPGAPVDLVVCNDAFYFLDDKAALLENLRQNAGDDGWLALSHIHNRDCPGFSAGRAVTAEEIAELFPDALVYDDAELTRALVEARAPTPAGPGVAADLRGVLGGVRPRDAPGAARPGRRPDPAEARHRAAAQPALRPRRDGRRQGGYVIRWPSERYEAEYAPRATYPLRSPGPEHLTFEGSLDAPETQRVRVREFVDLPERW